MYFQNLASSGKEVSKITVNSGLIKTKYYEGENIDFSGATLKIEYSDGTTITETLTGSAINMSSAATEVINMTSSMITGYNPRTLGNQTLTVNYEYGEDIDPTNGKIQVIKSSGVYTIPMTRDMLSGYEATRSGTQVTTVTYKDVITTYVVIVSEKPTATLGEKDEQYGLKDNTDNKKVIAGIIGILGLAILLLLILFRRNVKVYVEEDKEFVLGGIDKIKSNNPKLDVDKYLDEETYNGKVKIVLNDSISEKLDEKELEITHRGNTLKIKIKYNDEPFEIML